MSSKSTEQTRVDQAQEAVEKIRKAIAAQHERKTALEAEIEQLQVDYTHACSLAAIESEEPPKRPAKIDKLIAELETVNSVIRTLGPRFDEANHELQEANEAYLYERRRNIVEQLELEAASAWHSILKAYEVLVRTTGEEAYHRVFALINGVKIFDLHPAETACKLAGVIPGEGGEIRLASLDDITEKAAEISARLEKHSSQGL